MKGSCACGNVTYRCNDPVQVVNCHCTLCRSINGSAFSTYVVAKADTVEISGQNHLETYAVT
ncbi:MAG: GFA family protein, partial [Ktedonobacteraceae bacterium]